MTTTNNEELMTFCSSRIAVLLIFSCMVLHRSSSIFFYVALILFHLEGDWKESYSVLFYVLCCWTSEVFKSKLVVIQKKVFVEGFFCATWDVR